MGIRMQPAGLQVREVVKQCIKYVRRFIDTTGDEATEQRNVVIGNMAVGDTTGFAIANVMLSE